MEEIMMFAPFKGTRGEYDNNHYAPLYGTLERMFSDDQGNVCWDEYERGEEGWDKVSTFQKFNEEYVSILAEMLSVELDEDIQMRFDHIHSTDNIFDPETMYVYMPFKHFEKIYETVGDKEKLQKLWQEYLGSGWQNNPSPTFTFDIGEMSIEMRYVVLVAHMIPTFGYSEYEIADSITDELLENLNPNGLIEDMIDEHLSQDAKEALDILYERHFA